MYVNIFTLLLVLIRRTCIHYSPMTVASRFESWTVFVCSHTRVVGSNPIRAMDVCVYLFCVCAVLCVRSGLAMGCSPAQGVLPTVSRIKE